MQENCFHVAFLPDGTHNLDDARAASAALSDYLAAPVAIEQRDGGWALLGDPSIANRGASPESFRAMVGGMAMGAAWFHRMERKRLESDSLRAYNELRRAAKEATR